MNFQDGALENDDIQFFKEDRVEGAVYSLYLKKVRYHTVSDDVGTPSSSSGRRLSTWYLSTPGNDFDDGRTSLLQWRTIEIRTIKAGNLVRLVEALSNDTGDMDSTYVNVFLSTFRAFSSRQEVMDALLDRYVEIGDDPKMKQQAKESHRRIMRTVLSVWLDNYADDFKDPPSFPVLLQLIKFAENCMVGSDLGNRAQFKLEKYRKEEENTGPISLEDVEQHMNWLHLLDLPTASDSQLTRPVEFETIPDPYFAEQLTYIDAELFKKVIPYHCLGSVWSRGNKKRICCPSVYATVNQFNAVSYRVIATVLKNPDLDCFERAKIIEKWIEIAQELRMLKNFSSLKAIISGLQSNNVYRLCKVWAEVDRESMVLFHQLSDIFSEENNQMIARELLMKEGTAKFADLENSNTLRLHERRRSYTNLVGITTKRKPMVNLQSVAQGTVPYLGTFLTDLTMVDTAIPDITEDGLHNFDKRRKEFEILAQIRLLQSSAHMYQFKADPAFFEWFHSVRIYDDKESYELSCEIEPITPNAPREVKGHRKKSSLGFFSPRRPSMSMDDLANSSPTISISDHSISSLGEYSIFESPNTSSSSMSSYRPCSLRHSISTGSLLSNESDISSSPWRSPETCVVKVSMETTQSHHTNMYKSIMLTNSDHTRTVIRNIFLKFDVEGKPNDFVIFQLLDDDRELQIPDKGNVFYAINNNVQEVKFVLRSRADLEKLKMKQKKKKHRLKLTL